jgi:hypothetical protein
MLERGAGVGEASDGVGGYLTKMSRDRTSRQPQFSHEPSAVLHPSSVNQIERFYARHLPLSAEVVRNPVLIGNKLPVLGKGVVR